MKKIIAINSSKRKKNTYKLIWRVKEILEVEKIEVEIINLFDYRIEQCLGCENCLINGKCPLDDDTSVLMDKLRLADGIILSSPVYMESQH